MGGNGPGILERVVEFGDEWFPEDYQMPEELAVRIEQLQEAAERAGRQRIPVSIFGPKPKLDYWKRLAEAGVDRIVPTSRQPITTQSWRRSTSSPSSGRRSWAKHGRAAEPPAKPPCGMVREPPRQATSPRPRPARPPLC